MAGHRISLWSGITSEGEIPDIRLLLLLLTLPTPVLDGLVISLPASNKGDMVVLIIFTKLLMLEEYDDEEVEEEPRCNIASAVDEDDEDNEDSWDE